MPHSVKFRTRFLSRDVPGDERVSELIGWCRVFARQGLAPVDGLGSHGNLSCRLRADDSVFLITASSAGLSGIGGGMIVEVDDVDLESETVYARGRMEPSSESMLHHAIYLKRPDVGAVFHGHCKEILENAGRLGFTVTGREVPYGSLQLVESVLRVVEKKKFIVLRNHGFVSLGESMEDAGETALQALKDCD